MSFFYVAGYNKDLERITPLMVNDSDREGTSEAKLMANIDVFYRRFIHVYTFEGRYTVRVLLQELMGDKNISMHDLKFIKDGGKSDIDELNDMLKYVNSGDYEIDDIIKKLEDSECNKFSMNEVHNFK